jgi:hypothetical protein
LDEYEKSVFLTREMEGIVTALYLGADSYGGFELTEQMRRSLDALLETDVLQPANLDHEHIIDNSSFFILDDSLWYIIYEAARYGSDSAVSNCPSDTGSFPVEVVPVTHDEFHRIKGDPFRGPSGRRVLRLDLGVVEVTAPSEDEETPSTERHRAVELVSKGTVGDYLVKYIRRPKPIILEDLTESGLFINGENKQSGCELNESLHRLILDNAVRAAKAAYVGAAAS